jgi:hypothetical protein
MTATAVRGSSWKRFLRSYMANMNEKNRRMDNPEEWHKAWRFLLTISAWAIAFNVVTEVAKAIF